jgi:hypothetical protein
MLSVGASTSLHVYEDSYGPDQGFDQIASFSSRGPWTLGYPKPDVLAPGQANFGIYPSYGATFMPWHPAGPYPGYLGLQGTSMACPLAAGLAALVIDASPTPMTPDMVKTVIQSTADDIGMDGLSQGHGVINAWAAVDYVANGHGNTFYTYDSGANWGTAVADAWYAEMYPYTQDTFINESSPGLAANYADSNLYFGLVNEGDTATINVMGDYSGYTTWDWTDRHFVVDEVTEFTFETFIYNETTSTGSDNTLGGYIVLNTEMEAATAGSYARFLASDYATISVTGDQATFGDNSMWAFVFNWIDNDPANGVPDYYNPIDDVGDELTRWQYASGSGNILKMDLSHPDGLGSLFANNAIVMIHDDNIWSWPYTSGNMLNVSVTTWQEVDDPNIAITENAGTADVTLTVNAGTDYGIHQGFVIATNATDASHVVKLPYAYEVVATYDTAGTVMEIADGFGDVRTPYENGAVTAGWSSVYTDASGDHVSFVVNVTDATVNYLNARINWTNADTNLDVRIVRIDGFPLAYSGDAVKSSDTGSLAIANIAGATGEYIIVASMNQMDGTHGMPEEFTLSIVGLAAIDEPTLALTYTARDVLSPTPVGEDGTASGDHVMMKATWTDGVNPGMPEFGISTIQMKVLYGTLQYFEDAKMMPTDVSQFGALIDPTQFDWETAVPH